MVMSATKEQIGFDWEPTPTPKGRTFSEPLDGQRLAGQRERVMALMSDGAWRTLDEIQKCVGGSQTGIAARLREARTTDFGSHKVESRRRGNPKRGIYEYRVEVNQ
jgi:hypothetical protein